MPELADRLNRECHCVSLDRGRLSAFARGDGKDERWQELLATRPHLFSDSPAFLSRRWLGQMAEAIQAIEAVVALAKFQEQVRLRSGLPLPREAGVFMGYDFHLGPDGPRLIEINTNAGGAYLNLAVGHAVIECCKEIAPMLARRHQAMLATETEFAAMFREEFDRISPGRALQTAAICDVDPGAQYLYPEFLLWQESMRRAGIEALIVAPEELEFRNGALQAQGRPIDLVYNRLTDFDLSQPESAALRQAWLKGVAAVTPNPMHHALYANKNNLILLSDANALAELGADRLTIAALQRYVGRSVSVGEDNADDLWRERKRWFFKPVAGFGGKGAYRGDKLTTRVFAEIRRGGYIAQELCQPSERQVSDDSTLKMDIRNYVYAGKVQMLAARLYQGQTTNFRTPGGGFAPVFITPDDADLARAIAAVQMQA